MRKCCIAEKPVPVIECLLEAGAKALITVNSLTLLQMFKTDNTDTDVSDVFLRYMAFQLCNIFSSLVEEIRNDLARDINGCKLMLVAIQSKLMSDPEFSRVEGIANIGSLGGLFTCLQAHYDFLS